MSLNRFIVFFFLISTVCFSKFEEQHNVKLIEDKEGILYEYNYSNGFGITKGDKFDETLKAMINGGAKITEKRELITGSKYFEAEIEKSVIFVRYFRPEKVTQMFVTDGNKEFISYMIVNDYLDDSTIQMMKVKADLKKLLK